MNRAKNIIKQIVSECYNNNNRGLIKESTILNNEELQQFNDWIEDDNVIKVADNTYVEQTTQYRKKFTYDELQQFFKREYLGGDLVKEDEDYGANMSPKDFEAVQQYDGGSGTKYVFYNGDDYPKYDKTFRVETDYGIIKNDLSFDEIKDYISKNKTWYSETLSKVDTFEDYLLATEILQRYHRLSDENKKDTQKWVRKNKPQLYSVLFESKQNTIKENFDNFYQTLDSKQAIQKATVDYRFAMKNNNQAQADKIAGNLKSHLENQKYNWQQDPYALEILGESKKQQLKESSEWAIGEYQTVRDWKSFIKPSGIRAYEDVDGYPITKNGKIVYVYKTKKEALEHLKRLNESKTVIKEDIGTQYVIVNALIELWFILHESKTTEYQKIADKLDSLSIPYVLQNKVAEDATISRTRKHIDTFEVKDRVEKLINSGKQTESVIKEEYFEGNNTLKQITVVEAKQLFDKGVFIYIKTDVGKPESSRNLFILNNKTFDASMNIYTQRMTPEEYGFENIIKWIEERVDYPLEFYTLYNTTPVIIESKRTYKKVIKEEYFEGNSDYVDPITSARTAGKRQHNFEDEAIEYVGGKSVWNTLSTAEKNKIYTLVEKEWDKRHSFHESKQQMVKENSENDTTKYIVGDVLTVTDKNNDWYGKTVYVQKVTPKNKHLKQNSYLVALTKNGSAKAMAQSQLGFK